MKIVPSQSSGLARVAQMQAANRCAQERGLRSPYSHRVYFAGETAIDGRKSRRRDLLCALRSSSEFNNKGSSDASSQPRTDTTRRSSRSWIHELTEEILKARSDLLASQTDVIAAKSEVIAAKNEVIAAKSEVVNAKDKLAHAVRAHAEAERLALDRLRELGMVNARGIIEWAEVRAKNLHPEWSSLNRLALWTKIIQADAALRTCLTNAGWDNGTLSSNMVGLYASLSSDIHKDATPEVSQAVGGIVISVNDTGSGVNATAGKVLACVARANFIRASLRGRLGNDLEISKGLDDSAELKKILLEKKKLSSNDSLSA